jgi:hypothetical protein
MPRIVGELAGKPRDPALLECLTEQVGTLGSVMDSAVGPNASLNADREGMPYSAQ